MISKGPHSGYTVEPYSHSLTNITLCLYNSITFKALLYPVK
jgi:hypothetical protein